MKTNMGLRYVSETVVMYLASVIYDCFKVSCMSCHLYVLQKGSIIFSLGIHLVVELCIFSLEEHLVCFIKERINKFSVLVLFSQ